MKTLISNPSSLNFCIYGLGSTGESVVKYLKRKNFHNIKVWDDKIKLKSKKKNFSKYLDFSDYIILSPGISLNNAKLKSKLIKNKKKIITDIDLFYLFNRNIKSIVITGTNGKSTTCKILEHVLKRNKINVKLGGNIGKPILDINLNSNPIVIIEASSFQLAYSKFIKPDFAAILNITKDHLDWHGSMKDYVDSKFKIFSNQNNNDFAYLNNKVLIKKFKKNKFSSKLKYININKYKKLQNKINNSYLRSDVNIENLSYIFELSKKLKIKENNIIKTLKNFKGLEHRHEIFYKKNNKIFINDSKATSFDATKSALKSNKNIFWIVGGLPKKNDILNLSKLSKNIVKCYIIGKNINFFKRQIKNKLKFEVTHNLKNSIIHILKDIKKLKRKKNNILLSPASASFDQFSNFEIRGDKFKKLSRLYARKYI